MTVSAYTSNFKLALIDFNSQNWQGDDWSNWMLIDALLAAQFGNIAFTNGTGTNTITAAFATPFTAYTSGMVVQVKLANAPTGATTLNVDGLGAKNLYILGAPVASGDLQAGDIIRAIYDGSQFNVLDPVRRFGKITIKIGSSGVVADANYDDLVIDSAGNAGISILSSNTALTAVTFGRTGAAVAGQVKYNSSTGTMSLIAETAFNFNKPTTFIDTVTFSGATSFAGGITGNVTGNLTGNVTGNLTGNVTGNATNVTGTVAVANGGTGVTTITAFKAALAYGSLASLNTINGSNWSGSDLAIADGGTGASSAVAALTALGAVAKAGDTMTGELLFTSGGAYPHHANSANNKGTITIQLQSAAVAPANPGDISLEY